MRKLALPDAFKLARIIKAADISSEIAKFASKIQAKKASIDKAKAEGKKTEEFNTDEIGFEFIVTIIAAAGDVKVEKEFYSLLAGIKEVDIEEVKKMGFDELLADFKSISKDNDLASFFKSASSLISKI